MRVLFLLAESYLLTLLLHLAHAKPLLSAHTWLVALPGALLVLLAGGAGALAVAGLARVIGRRRDIAYVAWVVCTAIFGLALILGARPGIGG